MAETSSTGTRNAPRDDFVHLHVHTDYSMLDGAGKIKDYVAEARRLNVVKVVVKRSPLVPLILSVFSFAAPPLISTTEKP